jgi:hypothetical protein
MAHGETLQIGFQVVGTYPYMCSRVCWRSNYVNTNHPLICICFLHLVLVSDRGANSPIPVLALQILHACNDWICSSYTHNDCYTTILNLWPWTPPFPYKPRRFPRYQEHAPSIPCSVLTSAPTKQLLNHCHSFAIWQGNHSPTTSDWHARPSPSSWLARSTLLRVL